MALPRLFCFFFFNDPAPTEIYTLSLHDALPICRPLGQSAGADRQLAGFRRRPFRAGAHRAGAAARAAPARCAPRSEEHTSELQSLAYLVCRLLLEKKKHYVQAYTRATIVGTNRR